jgi:hypothetical protein
MLRTGGVSPGSGSMVQELSAEELQQLKKTGTVRKTQGQTTGTALSSSAILSPSPSSSISPASIPPSPLSTLSLPVSAGEVVGVGAAQSTVTEKNATSSSHNRNSLRKSCDNSNDSSGSSSSNGISSPRSATTTQGPQNDPESPSNRPQYSLVERGLVSMGDFETLKDKVASNR